MTRPAMPAGLVPLLSSYSIGAPSGALRTAVGGGMGRYGLEYARGSMIFNCSLFLSALQFSVWMVFYLRQTAAGTITFDMPLDGGYGVVPHACNIVPDSYNATRTGDAWVVSFQVESVSQVYSMSDAQAQSLLDLYAQYGEFSDALLKRLARFATVDTNVLDF
jgi:hypothetical protein